MTENLRRIEYIVNYPTHPPRQETAIYRKTRKELCSKLSCWICGRKDKLEAHHFFVAWAATEAVDWAEFGKAAAFFYNPQTGIHVGGSFDWNEVEKNPALYVDSPANMVVLCEEHHRSEQRGIHYVPFPDWVLQRFAKKDFKFLSVDML